MQAKSPLDRQTIEKQKGKAEHQVVKRGVGGRRPMAEVADPLLSVHPCFFFPFDFLLRVLQPTCELLGGIDKHRKREASPEI